MIKRTAKALLTLLLALALYAGQAAAAYARGPDNAQPGDIVYNETELAAWIEAHRTINGRVRLGNMIKITELLTIYDVSAYLTIDTGSYGLVYDGGSIHIEGLEITGEGVDVPVVDVYETGAFRTNWVHVIQHQRFTATGRGDIGGTAVRISQDDGYFVNLTYLRDEGSIRSYGKGAIGLYLAIPADAYCFNIKVEGTDSTAVYAEQGANLYYCKLKAAGDGAAAVSGPGKLVLETCAASPEPKNAQIINRRITGVVGNVLYFPIRQYEEFDFFHYDPFLSFFVWPFSFQLSNGDWDPMTEQFYLRLADNVPDTIDTGVLGRTVLQTSLDPVFCGLGLEEDFSLDYIVDVRDPSFPCISSLSFAEHPELGIYANLSFWDTHDPDAENVILWRSDDGGMTWYDFTDSPDIEWNESSLYFYCGEITGTVVLQLEVLDAGESNIVTLNQFGGTVTNGLGGDRIGTDRVVTENGKQTAPEAPRDEDDSGKTEDGSGKTEEGSGKKEDGSGKTEDGSGKTEDGSGKTGDGSGKTEDGHSNGAGGRTDGGTAEEDARIQTNAGNDTGGQTFLERQAPITDRKNVLAVFPLFLNAAFDIHPAKYIFPLQNNFKKTFVINSSKIKNTPTVHRKSEPLLDIPQRRASVSLADIHGGMVLTAVAAVLCAGAYRIRRTLRKGRRI